LEHLWGQWRLLVTPIIIKKYISNYGGPNLQILGGGGWVDGSQGGFDFLMMVSGTFCTAPPPWSGAC
jgi:hypothetical protein